MDTSSNFCMLCKKDHENPEYVTLITNGSACITHLSAKISQLEERLRTLGMECERELNRIHEMLNDRTLPQPAKSLPVQDKDNMWTRRFK